MHAKAAKAGGNAFVKDARKQAAAGGGRQHRRVIGRYCRKRQAAVTPIDHNALFEVRSGRGGARGRESMCETLYCGPSPVWVACPELLLWRKERVDRLR